MRHRSAGEGGFTLVEVVLALMVLAIAAVVLLDRRVGIIRETVEAKNAGMVWVLTANKMAELELDPMLWTGEGSSANGDFGEVGDEYIEFAWEYEIVKVELPMEELVDSQEAPEEAEEPKYIYMITLSVYAPDKELPYQLQAAFPPYELTEAAKTAEAAAKGENPRSPDAGSTPREK